METDGFSGDDRLGRSSTTPPGTTSQAPAATDQGDQNLGDIARLIKAHPELLASLPADVSHAMIR